MPDTPDTIEGVEKNEVFQQLNPHDKRVVIERWVRSRPQVQSLEPQDLQTVVNRAQSRYADQPPIPSWNGPFGEETGKVSTFGGNKDKELWDKNIWKTIGGKKYRMGDPGSTASNNWTTGDYKKLYAALPPTLTNKYGLQWGDPVTITNKKTGKSVTVPLWDHGPAPGTGRKIDISPYAMDLLGGQTDDEVTFHVPHRRLALARRLHPANITPAAAAQYASASPYPLPDKPAPAALAVRSGMGDVRDAEDTSRRQAKIANDVDAFNMRFFNTENRKANVPMQAADALSKNPNDETWLSRVRRMSPVSQVAIAMKAAEFRHDDQTEAVIYPSGGTGAPPSVWMRDKQTGKQTPMELHKPSEVLARVVRGPVGAEHLQRAQGFLSSAERFLYSLPDPENVGLLMVGGAGPRIAQEALGVGFTGMMAKNGLDKWRAGDKGGAYFDWLLASLGGYGSAKGAKAGLAERARAVENVRLQAEAAAQAGGESAFPYGRSVSDAAQARQGEEGRVGEHTGVSQGTNLPEDQGQVREGESGQAGGGRGVVGTAPVGTQEAQPEVKPAGRRRRDARGRFTIKEPEQPETPAQTAPEPVETTVTRPDGTTYTEHTMPSPLVAAAYRDPTGQVHTGANHPEILTGIHGKVPDEFMTAEGRNTPDFGFVDKAGNFLTREEAAVRAKQTGQDLKAFEPGEPAHSDEVAAKPGGTTPISEAASTTSAKPTFGDVLAKAHKAAVEKLNLQPNADVPIRAAWNMAKKLKLIDPKMTVEEFAQAGYDWNKQTDTSNFHMAPRAKGAMEGRVKTYTVKDASGYTSELSYVRAPKVEPPVEPPAPTPPPVEGTPEGETTGARKAITEPERAERGLEPVEMQLYQTPEIGYGEGKAAVESKEIDPQTLAASVAENPRTLTPKEIGALTYDRMRLKKSKANAYATADAALQSGDQNAYKEARNSIVHYSNLEDLNDQALRRSSREASAALQAYKMIVKDDFSFDQLSMQTRVRLGRELTPEETDAVSKLHTQLNNAVDALHQQEAYSKALEAKLAEANAAKTTQVVTEEVQTEKQRRRTGKRQDIAAEKKSIADEWAAIAARSKSRGGRATMGFDPTGGKLDEATVKELASLYIRQAKVWLTERALNAEELVDRLHDETVKHFPMLTKREVSDIFSGYGKTTEPTKQEPEATLREIKAQRRLLSALEDAEARERPQKSGFQRGEQSQRVRELTRQVHEAMAKAGIKTERTPEQQMATAMDAAKTHVRHQIEDLNNAIAKKTRLQRLPGKRLVPDEALTRMRAERDALQSMHDTMFEGEISQEKVDRVMNALADRIKAKQEALRTGDVGTKKTSPSITSPEIEKQRTEIKDLNKQIAELRKSKNAAQSREDYKLELAKRYQEAQEQIRTKKFPEKKERVDPYAADPEIALARRRLRVAQNQVRDLQEEAKRSGWEKVRRGGAEVLNIPRSIMETMNVHGTLRQALPLSISNPRAGARSVGYALRAMFDPKFAERVDAMAQHNENEGKYELMKLHFAQKGLTDREEAFMSNVAEKLPIAGPFVRASARSYNVGLNVLRSAVADASIAKLEADGMTVQSHPEVYRNVGSFINKMTGWGDLGSASAFAQELNSIFYSPRLSLSRLQLMRDAATGFRGYDSFTRKMAMKSLAANITFQITMMAAAKASGFNVGTDPGSADFGKLIVGNTRVDITGGFGSFIRPVIRMGTMTKRYYSGEVKPKALQQTAEDVGYRATKSKFAPPLSGLVETLATKDPAGHPVSTFPQLEEQAQQMGTQLSQGDFKTPISTFLGSAAGERLSPIFVRELASAIQEGPMGTGLAALAFFGAGETSYEPKEKKQPDISSSSLKASGRSSFKRSF